MTYMTDFDALKHFRDPLLSLSKFISEIPFVINMRPREVLRSVHMIHYLEPIITHIQRS